MLLVLGRSTWLLVSLCVMQAGMRILQQGGNAADAAVAVAAALNMTEPTSTGTDSAQRHSCFLCKLQHVISAAS